MRRHLSHLISFLAALCLAPAAASPLIPAHCAHPAQARVSSSQELIDYCEVDGLALLGDILLGTHTEIQQHGVSLPLTLPWPRQEEQQNRILHAPDRKKRARRASGLCNRCTQDPRPAASNTTGCRPAAGFSTEQTGSCGQNQRDNRFTASSTSWPLNTVYYAFDASATPGTRQAIQEAIEEFHSKTNVRFVPRSHQPDFVNISSVPPSAIYCGYATLGRAGTRQTLAIARDCETTLTSLHELQHTLGFGDHEIRNTSQLSREDIEKINRRYPANAVSRSQAQLIPQLSTRTLVIDQGGLGQIQVYLNQADARLQRITSQASGSRPSEIHTSSTRIDAHRFLVTIRPQQAFSGSTTLTFHADSAQGQTARASMELKVMARRVSTDRSRPLRNSGLAGRQLLSRHGENQCMSALAHTEVIQSRRCQPGIRQQLWHQHGNGQIESLAHPGYCLSAAGERAAITLARCNQRVASQRWLNQGEHQVNQYYRGMLSISSNGSLMLFPATERAPWQLWDWR